MYSDKYTNRIPRRTLGVTGWATVLRTKAWQETSTVVLSTLTQTCLGEVSQPWTHQPSEYIEEEKKTEKVNKSLIGLIKMLSNFLFTCSVTAARALRWFSTISVKTRVSRIFTAPVSIRPSPYSWKMKHNVLSLFPFWF